MSAHPQQLSAMGCYSTEGLPHPDAHTADQLAMTGVSYTVAPHPYYTNVDQHLISTSDGYYISERHPPGISAEHAMVYTPTTSNTQMYVDNAAAMSYVVPVDATTPQQLPRSENQPLDLVQVAEQVMENDYDANGSRSTDPGSEEHVQITPTSYSTPHEESPQSHTLLSSNAQLPTHSANDVPDKLKLKPLAPCMDH